MKSIFSFTVFLIIYTNAFSQHTLNIKSKLDGSNLSYTTVYNLTQNIAYSANEKGNILFDAKDGDSLSFSRVGYLPLIYIYSNNLKYIELLPDTSLLLPVIISNCKSYKNYVLKNKRDKKKNYTQPGNSNNFGGYFTTFHGNSYPVGIFLKSNFKTAKLKKFSFWLKKYTAPDSAVFAPMLINIFSVDDSTDLPSKTLLSESIVYFPVKEGKQTLNLDSLQISIPQNGIYILLQYVMDKKYAWEIFLDDGGVILQNGLTLDGFYNPELFTTMYISKTNSWVKKVGLSLIYEAILSYCSDNQIK